MTSLARVGSVVAGKYKLLQRLGGGGMGEVFRAEHQYAGRVVALKLLRKDFANDPDLTRRFFQEAQAVNKIRHTNIVDVLDAGLCEEGPYVAMEILEGSSLSGALARIGRFDLTAALAVVVPMLNALDAAHRLGIVHRDLKPENVFLAQTQTGVVVKLLDFGIAKILGSGTDTNTGIVFGTPDYLSPEQASGEGVVDGRSDVFAAGIVLFELLTGRRPFEAQSAVATAYKIVHVAAPRIASLGVIADPRVQDVIDLALAKSQEDRFGSAQSFADMLAPLAPDGAARRAALVSLLDAVTGLEPTMAVPPPGPVEEKDPPREADPDRGRQGAPTTVGEVLAGDTPPGSDDANPLPVASPRPPSAPPPVKASAPLAPTLASPRGAFVPLATVVAPERASLGQSPRAPVVTPTYRDPQATPSYRDEPAVTPAWREPLFTPPAIREPVVTPRFRDARPSPPARVQGDAARRSSPDLTTPTKAPLPTVSRRLSPVPSASSSLSGPTLTARRSIWTPRALPAHVRGKCHVRGSVPRAAGRWIERVYGTVARDEVLRALGGELADSYRTDGFNALVWYDVEALDTFLEAATALVLGGDVGPWRTMARDHFERELGPIFRPNAVRSGEPIAVLKRSVAAWSRLYDFAGVRVSDPSSSSGGATNRISLRFDGFDAASLALRNVTLGTAEGLLRSATGGEVTARAMVGEASFAREFEIELAWVVRP